MQVSGHGYAVGQTQPASAMKGLTSTNLAMALVSRRSVLDWLLTSGAAIIRILRLRLASLYSEDFACAHSAALPGVLGWSLSSAGAWI